MSIAPANYAFASDNTAGICPEALNAIQSANSGFVPSYGDDAHTIAAKRAFADVFETDCEVFFLFNGTAANSVVLAALCQPHHAILCHALAHVETDECGAPEFFTGGSKVLPIAGADAKLCPADVEPVLKRGHGVHFPKARVLSLTQSTELGTLYTADEMRALADYARANQLVVHVDGARFANAAAAFAERAGDEGQGRGAKPKSDARGPGSGLKKDGIADTTSSRASTLGRRPANPDSRPSSRATPAELTWRAGVDVLSFGGTKNGLLSTEAVVFFNRELAREFEYRVKQGGQLASKMRFASAQWAAVLRDGAWLRHAAHANRQASTLSAGLRAVGFSLVARTEVNGVFVEMQPEVVRELEARGWRFYKFVGEHGYRLMCSWQTQDSDIAKFLADARAAKSA